MDKSTRKLFAQLKKSCNTKSKRIAYNKLVRSFAKYPRDGKFYNTEEYKILDSLNEDKRRGDEIVDGDSLEFQLYNLLAKTIYRYFNDGDEPWYDDCADSWPYMMEANDLLRDFNIKQIWSFDELIDATLTIVKKINEGESTDPISKTALNKDLDDYFKIRMKNERKRWEEEDEMDNNDF